MINQYTNAIKWQQTGLTILLGIIMTSIILFVLWSTAAAGNIASGAGGCGDFDQAIKLAQDGDTIVQMTPPKDSGGAVITENLRLSGGWFPSQNCDETNQFFTTTADYLAHNFAYVAPITRAELFAFNQSILILENPAAAAFPQLDELVIENMILDVEGTAVNGGGITGIISDAAHVLLDAVYFRENDVTNQGGGLYLEVWDGSHLIIDDNQFTGNTATNDGGGLHIILRGGSQLTIENSQFISNTAVNGGGFEIHVYDTSQVTIRNTTFLSNTGTNQGAAGRIIMYGGSLSILNSTFQYNQGTDTGGALYVEMNGGQLTIADSTFENNTAYSNGGGLYVQSAGDETAAVNLINTTFTNNAPNGFSSSGPLNTAIYSQQIYMPLILNATTPDPKQARINNITLDNGFNYVVDFETHGFTPDTSGWHVHFFFDTVLPQYAGTELCPYPSDPAQCQWKLYGGTSPFTGYTFADQPFTAAGADKMCILVANAQHEVLLNTGNCVKLP